MGALVLNLAFVILCNISANLNNSASNPPLRQAQKRYGQVYVQTTKRKTTDKRPAKGKL